MKKSKSERSTTVKKSKSDRTMNAIAYKPPKPSMSIKSTQLKSVKGMKVGSKVKFEIAGKVNGVNEDYDNSSVHRAEIEISSVKSVKGWGKHIGGVVK